MTLKTTRLKLRNVTLSDVNDIHILHSLPETDQYNTLGIPNTLEETKNLVLEWLALCNVQPPKLYIFCIEDKEQLIGIIGIITGKPKYQNAEIWYKLHSKYWNRGYATEVVKEILNFCFTELRLHRVEAGCATGNIASIKVLEKAGMRREGLKRKVLPIRGEWVDNYIYAILEVDYHAMA
jgi:[ribosomal protein S5]-alanine N-acetyltransferase